MKEPIVVDMALAYQQMRDNPDLLVKFSELLQSAMPSYEEIFDGWVVRTRYRKLDVDKNPITEWSAGTYRSASRSTNPYVYQKGRHGEKDQTRQTPMFDDSNPPKSPAYPQNVKYGTEEYKAYERMRAIWHEEYKAWAAARPIVGYYEHETRVLPAKIVVEA